MSETKRMVAYTDSSVRPNPGFGGCGLHGYVFTETEPTKNVARATILHTKDGYLAKDEKNKKDTVTVEHYFDGYGSFSGMQTNNSGEIQACVMLFDMLTGEDYYDIKSVLVYTDSEFLNRGFNHWMDVWSQNGWCKADGMAVSNRTDWQNLLQLRNILVQKGLEIEVKWIKGHAGHHGNELADKHAVTGTFNSIKGRVLKRLVKTTAEEQWPKDSEKHPMFSHRRMYFDTTVGRLNPGVYYLGDHGYPDKFEHFIGTKNADSCYSVIKLKEPEPVLEFLMETQKEVSNHVGSFYIAKLSNVFKTEVYTDITLTKDHTVGKVSPHRDDLQHVTGLDLTREIRPVGHAMRAADEISELHNRLEDFEDYLLNGKLKDDLCAVTNITSLLYDTEEKEDKKTKEKTTVLTIKKDIRMGYNVLKFKADYVDNTDPANLTTKSIDLGLNFGKDLADRNTLKRFEEYNPEVYIFTWKCSQKCVRYATVIRLTTTGETGIWASSYSNRLYVS
ncbi:MAG: hypothetical protein E6Q68_06865 [Polynucleobacter sp.]|nr:MAG: hypothetical protein E6Q68_06865 [Polynucleobacter sp.]